MIRMFNYVTSIVRRYRVWQAKAEINAYRDVMVDGEYLKAVPELLVMARAGFIKFGQVKEEYRRITKRGVVIQGVSFYSPEMADLVGKVLLVEVPEGPLPEVLHATYEARPLVLRRCPEQQPHNDA